MASKSTFVCVAFLVLCCFMLLKDASACKSGQDECFIAEASPERHSRKVLGSLMEKSGAVISGNVNKEFNAWELRKVPSGPDPLHHNGNNPKKPRSP